VCVFVCTNEAVPPTRRMLLFICELGAAGEAKIQFPAPSSSLSAALHFSNIVSGGVRKNARAQFKRKALSFFPNAERIFVSGAARVVGLGAD
jgi:hypothetical protein